MNREGTSMTFYVLLIAIAIIFLIIGFYYLPQNRYDEFIGTGDSMEPTLSDGDILLVDPKAKPQEMDLIVFSCLDCKNLNAEEILTKRVYEFNDQGCMWLLGDNQAKSYDSTEFGWICANDMELYGVVVDIKEQ